MQKTVESKIDLDLRLAHEAARFAYNIRVKLRRATFKGGDRDLEIEAAISACRRAAKPIRKYIGMLPTHPELAAVAIELREVSVELTKQRRALRKMMD